MKYQFISLIILFLMFEEASGQASMASGYKFKLVSVKSRSDSTIVELVNLGVALIYIDVYLTVDGIR